MKKYKYFKIKPLTKAEIAFLKKRNSMPNPGMERILTEARSKYELEQRLKS